MTTARSRRMRWSLAVLAVFVACGENLIDDPSFELWCGKSLCKPWEVEGTITQVATWHRRDFGVALSDGALISQLSTKPSVKCIEFEVIADVDAASGVSLEMDFDDDGTSEYQQPIAESHWAKLRFLVTPPRWYERVRFMLRKAGHGRAVLAQIKATSSGECDAPPLPATNRPNGVDCGSASECAGGSCEDRVELLGPQRRCGECSASSDCAEDAVCGVARSEYGVYRTCVPRGGTELGGACLDAVECASGRCTRAAGVAPSNTCAACARDDECAAGEVCGIGVTEHGAARMCRPLHERQLGELCAVDAECQSEVCGLFGCGECNPAHPCADQAECITKSNIRGQFLAGISLCGGGRGARQPGEACNDDDDCASEACDLPAPICYLCDADSCQDMNTATCGPLRRLAGVCR